MHLIPYHGIGESKIDLIDGDQPRLGLPGYPAGRFDEAKAFFRSRGSRSSEGDETTRDGSATDAAGRGR